MWSPVGTSAPAVRDDETSFVYASREITHVYTGTIALNLTSKLQASLGYSFGTSTSFTHGQNSAPLKKGEYVKTYWRPIYSKSEVYQREVLIVGPNIYPTGKTKHATCYEGKMVEVRIDYYNADGTLQLKRSNNSKEKSKIYKTDYFKIKAASTKQ